MVALRFRSKRMMAGAITPPLKIMMKPIVSSLNLKPIIEGVERDLKLLKKLGEASKKVS